MTGNNKSKHSPYRHRKANETRIDNIVDISRLRKDATVKNLQSMQAKVFTDSIKKSGKNQIVMLKNIREIDREAFEALVRIKRKKLYDESIKEGYKHPDVPGWYEESNMINTITRDEIDRLKERSGSSIVVPVPTNAVAHMDRRQEKTIQLSTNNNKLVDLKTFGKSKEAIQSTNRLEDNMKYVHHPRYLLAQHN